jgi:hypothetical protein
MCKLIIIKHFLGNHFSLVTQSMHVKSFLNNIFARLFPENLIRWRDSNLDLQLLKRIRWPSPQTDATPQGRSWKCLVISIRLYGTVKIWTLELHGLKCIVQVHSWMRMLFLVLPRVYDIIKPADGEYLRKHLSLISIYKKMLRRRS